MTNLHLCSAGESVIRVAHHCLYIGSSCVICEQTFTEKVHNTRNTYRVIHPGNDSSFLNKIVSHLHSSINLYRIPEYMSKKGKSVVRNTVICFFTLIPTIYKDIFFLIVHKRKYKASSVTCSCSPTYRPCKRKKWDQNLDLFLKIYISRSAVIQRLSSFCEFILNLQKILIYYCHHISFEGVQGRETMI